MRKLILKMDISLDGFVASADGSGDWIFEDSDPAVSEHLLHVIKDAGVFIMGSNTFRDMASYWPFSKAPFAEPMNQKPKVVFSRHGVDTTPDVERGRKIFENTPKDDNYDMDLAKANTHTWINATVASGDLKEEINKLKQQEGGFIMVFGGASFVSSLIKENLIDEYHFYVVPIILGKGLPIFADVEKHLKLEVISHTAFSSGVSVNVYRPRVK